MLNIAKGFELDVDRLTNERFTTRANILEISQLEDNGQPFEEVFTGACARFLSQIKVLRAKLQKLSQTLNMDNGKIISV